MGIIAFDPYCNFFRIMKFGRPNTFWCTPNLEHDGSSKYDVEYALDNAIRGNFPILHMTTLYEKDRIGEHNDCEQVCL